MTTAPDERTEPQSKPTATSASTTPPSYAPFFLALGVTMLFWGVLTSLVMSAGGLVLLVWGLWTWIAQIAKAWRN